MSGLKKNIQSMGHIHEHIARCWMWNPSDVGIVIHGKAKAGCLGVVAEKVQFQVDEHP